MNIEDIRAAAEAAENAVTTIMEQSSEWEIELTGDDDAPRGKAEDKSAVPPPDDDGGTDTAARLLAEAIAEPVRTFAEIAPRVRRERPELIEGVLFEGGELIIAGLPKVGKSTLMSSLMVSAASGDPWLSHKVRRCSGLLVNTENDLDDYGNAIQDCIDHARGDVDLNAINVLDLNGKAHPLDVLAESIISKANKIADLGFIVLDPIYPVLTGDENSNSEMAAFTNLFRLIRTETSAALVFCHHHSKGAGQYSEAMYRASGAGVFQRHPTTIMDVSRVTVKPDTRKARLNIEQCHAIDSHLARIGCKFKFTPETRKMADEYRRACVDVLEPDEMGALIDELDATEKRVMRCEAVRIDITRRGAAKPPTSTWWYDYPAFALDRDGLLKPAKDNDGKPDRDELTARVQADKNALIRAAVEACEADGVTATRTNAAKRIGKVNGNAVSRDLLSTWTQDKTKWCRWRVHDVEGESVLYCLDDVEATDTDE